MSDYGDRVRALDWQEKAERLEAALRRIVEYDGSCDGRYGAAALWDIAASALEAEGDERQRARQREADDYDTYG